MMNKDSFGTAELKCRSCKHEWEAAPGPAACPKCGHHYVDWVNYEEWSKEYEKHKESQMPENAKLPAGERAYFNTDSKSGMIRDAQATFRIVLDVDGPLAQFSEGVAKLYGISPEEIYSRWPAGKYAIEEALDTDWKELCARINAEGEGFWTGLGETPWAREFYEACCELAPTYLFTAPLPGLESAHCWSGKFKWCHNFVGEENSRKILVGHPKFMTAAPGTIIVDDGDHNVESFNLASWETWEVPETTPILWPNICNSGYERFQERGDKVYLDILEEIKEAVSQTPSDS
jgi:hypothetical protein